MAQTKAQLISGASSQSVTFNDATVSSINGGPIGGARNRIINGDMRIDQRNAGASISTNSGFPVDRWITYFAGGGVFSGQRSTTAPAGFANSLLATVTTADSSIAATDNYLLRHNIEGFNVDDLAWGTANAKTVTLSFWVRSSITGTYGGALTNDGENRSYPFTYNINSANTFEYKTITIAGDTTGSWLTNSSRGVAVNFSLGMGSTYTGTANAWAAALYLTATGSTNWISTNGATFYITGVQLEAGSTATPFERRSYGQELALCQRYYQQIGKTSSSNDVFAVGYTSTNQFFGAGFLRASMRAAPTFSYSGTLSDLNYTHPAVSANVSSISSSFTNTESYAVILNSATGTTNGFGAFARCVTANVAVTFTAEL